MTSKTTIILLATFMAASAVLATTASAHPSKTWVQAVAQAKITEVAGSWGGARVNRVGRHKIDAVFTGEHFRTAYGGYEQRCGRRGAYWCFRPVQVDVGVKGILDGGVRVYSLHKCRAADHCVNAPAASAATVKAVTVASGRRAIRRAFDPDRLDWCRRGRSGAVSCRVTFRDGVEITAEDAASGEKETSMSDVVFRVTALREHRGWSFVA
jgi:hypothetical protein